VGRAFSDDEVLTPKSGNERIVSRAVPRENKVFRRSRPRRGVTENDPKSRREW
jgi:hypothetical protein